MNRCVAETDPLGRTTRGGYDAAGRLAWQESPDGRRTTWTYDAAGRPASMAVDGRTVTALTRDLRRRTVRVTDDTGEGNEGVERELEWNGRGLLVRRSRGGRTLRLDLRRRRPPHVDEHAGRRDDRVRVRRGGSACAGWTTRSSVGPPSTGTRPAG